MAEKCVTYDADGPVAVITLNRPEKLNAINDAIRAEAKEAFLRADEDDDIAVVVLRGEGRSFLRRLRHRWGRSQRRSGREKPHAMESFAGRLPGVRNAALAFAQTRHCLRPGPCAGRRLPACHVVRSHNQCRQLPVRRTGIAVFRARSGRGDAVADRLQARAGIALLRRSHRRAACSRHRHGQQGGAAR